MFLTSMFLSFKSINTYPQVKIKKKSLKLTILILFPVIPLLSVLPVVHIVALSLKNTQKLDIFIISCRQYCSGLTSILILLFYLSFFYIRHLSGTVFLFLEDFKSSLNLNLMVKLRFLYTCKSILFSFLKNFSGHTI